MENIRSFVNQHATVFLMLILGVVVLFSFGCGPVDEEDVEKTAATRGNRRGQRHPSEWILKVTVEEPVGLETLTFTIDATNREAWGILLFCHR